MYAVDFAVVDSDLQAVRFSNVCLIPGAGVGEVYCGVSVANSFKCASPSSANSNHAFWRVVWGVGLFFKLHRGAIYGDGPFVACGVVGIKGYVDGIV